MYDNTNFRNSTYKAYREPLNKEIGKALDSIITGGPITDYLTMFNAYHTLLGIGWEGVIGMTKDDMACMSEAMLCDGVYPTIMNNIYMEQWGELNNPEPPTALDDGINFMQTRGTGIIHPINRIR